MPDNSAEKFFLNGLQFEKISDYDSAINEFNEALKQGFKSDHLYIALGRIYREKIMYEDSIKNFRNALEVSPEKNTPFFRNKILNEIEISQKKTELKSKFRGLGVVLTTKCNLRCIMCNSWSRTWDIPQSTVTEIIEHIPYLQRVMWLGGEVFLSEHFEALFDTACNNYNLHQTVVTDGLLIDKDWASKLVRANIDLKFSIDGMKKETYEYIRKGADFDKLIKNIDMVNSMKDQQKEFMTETHRMVTSINYVVMKTNYREVIDAMDFAVEHNFDDLTLTPIDYVENEENIFLNRDQEAKNFLTDAIPEIEKKAAEHNVVFNNWLPEISLPEKTLSLKSDEIKDRGTEIKDKKIFCFWPWQHLFIDIGGQVKPHCLCLNKVGNVLDNTIMEIWNNEQMQDYRRIILENDFKGSCNKVCVNSPIARDCMGLSW